MSSNRQMNSDRQITERVWHDLHAALLGFIRQRVGDQTLADDLLQDVFVRIQDRIDTLQETDRLRAWVYQITRNVITDYFRARDKNAKRTPESEPVADESTEANLNAEVAGWLTAMVDDLPDTYRDALRLSELDGMRQKQVAEALSISLSGAKSRIQRGRLILKEALLRCCHFELDERGNVIDFNQRAPCSDCCSDDSSC